MMLTPEQLRNMRQAANGLWKVEFDGRGIRQIVEHIDAQQERIVELEENAKAHKLAMQASKAMLQGETARADAAERDRDHWKANHENQVRRARIMMDRPDMPIERVKAYQHMLELEKDAARYRFLRNKAYVGECYTERGKVYEISGMDIEVKLVEVRGGDDGDEVDAAIDAAMQK